MAHITVSAGLDHGLVAVSSNEVAFLRYKRDLDGRKFQFVIHRGLRSKGRPSFSDTIYPHEGERISTDCGFSFTVESAGYDLVEIDAEGEAELYAARTFAERLLTRQLSFGSGDLQLTRPSGRRHTNRGLHQSLVVADAQQIVRYVCSVVDVKGELALAVMNAEGVTETLRQGMKLPDIPLNFTVTGFLPRIAVEPGEVLFPMDLEVFLSRLILNG